MDYSIFRKNLADLIRSRGHTPFSFSIDINITPSTVQRHLAGTRVPDIDTLVRYAEYFGVSLDWFLGYSVEAKSSISPEAQELINLFSIASDDDKNVIRLLLSRYK